MRFFKKQKRLPVSLVCRNCGTQTVGRYCHTCGQDIFAGRNTTFSSVFYSFLENVFAFDNKIIRTLRYLLFRPGFLSSEYVSGHISRYVQPAKLYWFISIVFFTLFTSQILQNMRVNNWQEKDIAQQENKAPIDSLLAHSIDSAFQNYIPLMSTNQQKAVAGADGFKGGRNREGKIDFNESKRFVEQAVSLLPYIMFFYLPIFALITYWLFRKNRRYYVNHLVFSAHLHAFLFVVYSIFSMVGLLLPKDVGFPTWVVIAILLAQLTYYFSSLRVFYKVKYTAVFFRGSIAFILNMILLLMFTILALLVIYTIKGVPDGINVTIG